jgi:hypothetical protein
LEDGARARLERFQAQSASTQQARCRLGARIRQGSLDQDEDAADRVKRLGIGGA